MSQSDTIRVLSTFTDPRMGGPHRRSLAVARRLLDQGIETTFVLPHGGDKFEAVVGSEFEVYRRRLPRIRPPIRVGSNARFLGSFPFVTRNLRRFIDRHDFDIVHTNMAFNFQSALAGARSDARTIWHFNDTLTPTPVRQVAGFLGPRLADQPVVAADAVHEYFFKPGESSKTIYAPVDVELFNPDEVEHDEKSLRSELSLPDSLPVVGTVGNVNPIKGHRYLLAAIDKLNDSDQEVAVPIVGEVLSSRKSYYEELQAMRAEFGLEEQVRFIGFRSDVAELYSLFDVFVLPSVAEACPMVVLEAMAMRCPVVATDVGGVREQIPSDEYGWVVPPKDSDLLAESIQEILESPAEAKKRGQNARNWVKEQFSLAACADQHAELYRSLYEG